MNTLAIGMLAVMDGWSIAQWAFNIIFTVALGIHKAQAGKIDKLMDELRAANRTEMERRFVEMQERFNSHVQPLIDKIDEVKMRLRDGDKTIDGLSERDFEIKLSIEQKMNKIFEYIRDRCAGKEDLREHERSVQSKLENLGKGLHGLNLRFARNLKVTRRLAGGSNV